MGIRQQEGFTIIETTLFLAITGLLILMIVGGVGVSLNVQRYRDAVESFKSLIQQQYSDLANVQNGRDQNWTCDTNSVVTQGGGNDTLRGQSDCFLVGKYLRIEEGEIAIYPVLATQRSTTVQSSDIATMQLNYTMNVASSDVEERSMEWGTQIAWATAGPQDVRSPRTPRSLGIFFVRSPESGLVYTLTSDSVPAKDSIGSATFSNLLVAGATVPGQAARSICVESGGLFVDGDMELYLGAYATGINNVETRTNSYNTSLSGVGATQC